MLQLSNRINHGVRCLARFIRSSDIRFGWFETDDMRITARSDEGILAKTGLSEKKGPQHADHKQAHLHVLFATY